MDILKVGITNGYDYITDHWLFSNVGEELFHVFIADLQCWFPDTNNRIKTSIPFIISLLVHNENYNKLVPYLKTWANNRSVSNELIVNIIKSVFQQNYDRISSEPRYQKFIVGSKCLLMHFLIARQIEPDIFTREHNDSESLQCGNLIYAFENYSSELDYSQIRHQLSTLHGFDQIVTRRWINRMEGKKNRTNQLLRSLNRTNDASLAPIDIILQRLIGLNTIGTAIFKISKCREKLQNDFHVHDAFAELRLAKLLMDNSFQIINLDAPVGQRGKDFDMLTEVGGERLYIEVIRIGEFPPLQYFGGAQYITSTLIQNKISHKYFDRFVDLRNSDTAILAIDNSLGAAAIRNEIEQAFYGNMELMRAVLLFDDTSVDLIPNPKAEPLSSQLTEKLENL